MQSAIRFRPCPEPLPDLGEVHPVLRRVYAARQVLSREELTRSLKAVYDYRRLLGIDAAVERLVRALEHGERILIVGDFDADGATSTAVAVRALRQMGAAEVAYLVPNRFDYGYGLTPEIVAVATRSRPDLIITVDNGISSHAGVAAARDAGIDVLVTDHHLPAETLPPAVAIVNPNQPGDPFPSKCLAGVGVVFYVMAALRAALRARDWFATHALAEPNLAQWLDLVAVGTVADVVPLDRNNRILVSQGLARIRAGQCCAGISALLRRAGRDVDEVVAADLGFALGPRLNAAGRLEDMSVGIECLLSDTPEAADALAARLDELNRERRVIEEQMQAEAWTHLDELVGDDPDRLPYGLCLYQSAWHQGVIGIVASRIKDRLHRPVIAFADAGEGMLKGSARSVSGLHVRDALDAVAARHPGLLTKFGGHAMAAGLSLERERFETFSAAFDEEVRRHLSATDLQGLVHSDGELSAEELTLGLAEILRGAGPWGQGFPEPVFHGDFEVIEGRIVGERHLRLLLHASASAAPVEAIAFNHGPEPVPERGERLRLVYRLDVNRYRGERRLQLIVLHLLSSRE